MVTGLCNAVKLYTVGEIDDGAGGIEPHGETVLAASWPCRITTLSGKEEIEEFGQAGPRHWKVIGSYQPLIEENTDNIQYIKSIQQPSPLADEQGYRIVRARHQQNKSGGMHHTSLLIEKE